MTELELRAARLWQLLSEEADDYPLERITRSSRLARDLNLSGIQRIALAYRIEAEFSIEFDEAAFDAIVNPTATVADVLSAVARHVQPTKASTA